MEKLKIFKENIFSWYKWKENATARIFSQDDDYKEILERKVRLVTNQEKLDYVIFIGENNITQELQQLVDQLEDETKVIVIGENDLSVKNISTYPDSEEMLQKKDIFTVTNLENEMKNLGFGYCNIYYAFPNYNFVDMIFKKTYNIQTEQVEKYRTILEENQIRVLDEIELLKKIIAIDKNMLDIFANSYFIEFSKKQIEQDINYVSFNNTRKEEYRLMTVLREKVVEKIAVNDKAKAHLENMQENIELLKTQKVNLLDYSENNRCYSKLIKDESTFDMILAEQYEDLDSVASELNKIREILLENAIDYNTEIENSLKEYEINPEKIKELKFLENAFVDFVPKNCFKIGEELYFFDQEWRRKFLPVDFIIYRGVINCYNLVKKININELFDKLNLTKYVDVFEQINQKIMQDILDKELYEEIVCREIRKIDNIINERKIALAQVSDLQAEDAKKEKVIETLLDAQKDNQKKEEVICALQEEEKNKSEYIINLENLKTSCENEIARLHEIDKQKDEIINNLNEIIKVKDNQIEIFENMKAVKIIKKLRGKK